MLNSWNLIKRNRISLFRDAKTRLVYCLRPIRLRVVFGLKGKLKSKKIEKLDQFLAFLVSPENIAPCRFSELVSI